VLASGCLLVAGFRGLLNHFNVDGDRDVIAHDDSALSSLAFHLRRILPLTFVVAAAPRVVAPGILDGRVVHQIEHDRLGGAADGEIAVTFNLPGRPARPSVELESDGRIMAASKTYRFEILVAVGLRGVNAVDVDGSRRQ